MLRIWLPRKSSRKLNCTTDNRNLDNTKITGANESWRCRTAREKFYYENNYLELPSIHGLFCFYNSPTEQV